jgi:Leucine-rich repeat (LRR) protein
LDISGIHINDLSPLLHLHHLEELNLERAEIQNLEVLTQSCFPELKRMTIGNDMPPEQIEALRKQLPGCDIEVKIVR